MQGTQSQLLQSTLREFGFEGRIDRERQGPVVTVYDFIPQAGVKMSKIIGTADDIARSLGVASCRITAAQGRNALSFELPNAKRTTVKFSDMLKWLEYNAGDMALPIAMGESIEGEPIIADLAKMPHLLVGGTTGSGKSVGVNTMILSLISRMTPEQVQFVMIDPKMLELSIYDGIPHLQQPVITDPREAVTALGEVVTEMERRYALMADLKVRNIKSYNEEVLTGGPFEQTTLVGHDRTGREIYETQEIIPATLPYIVVVIDEVADLMLVAGKEVEKAVQRLAQMARAAGIHLIMATQRPSVDVITGTIKANFPSRVAFQVTSGTDSRTILGEQGAEKLLGMGDMLFQMAGSEARRIHGSFASDTEVARRVTVARYGR